jgi:hypothetical protein
MITETRHLSKMEQLARLESDYPISMKKSELTNKQKLLVPCPICRAAIGVHCKLYSGLGRRKEPHSERKYQAIQALEQVHGPRGRHSGVASSSCRT